MSKLVCGVYRHFKGNLYRVLGVAEHSETGEQMVVYLALYGEGKMYVRPLDSFTSPVDSVEQRMRFELISM